MYTIRSVGKMILYMNSVFNAMIHFHRNTEFREEVGELHIIKYRNYSNLKHPLINAHRPFLAKIVIYFPLILLACPKFLVIYFPLIINAQPNLR